MAAMNSSATASLETLQHRAALLAAVRSFFTEHGYWECETPVLSRDVVVDANLHPLSTQVCGETLFLQTSPEAGMKRLLAEGAGAIFQVTRAFRQGECGPLHNPEFTMVEWYHVNQTFHDQMQFVEQLVQHVCAAAAQLHATPSPSIPGDAFTVGEAQFERLSYDEAFQHFAGQGVLTLETPELISLARKHRLNVPVSLARDDRDGWLNFLLAELVEPQLGRTRPVFLFDYPATQCALARIRDTDPPVAERFELYCRGIELCNGYTELTDADVLISRTERERELRRQAGDPDLPGAAYLEAAMVSGLPPCAGVALGFDRLVMLALGCERLAQVQAFPFDRA